MNQTFPHFYSALSWLLGYYEISKVKEQFEYIGKTGYGGANSSTVNDIYELNFLLQERMEVEIDYTIRNTYPAAQIIHLQIFKDWLSDYRISKTNEIQVLHVINTHNENLYERFKAEIQVKEAEFKATPYYSLENGAEYTVKERQFTGGMGLLSMIAGGVLKEVTKKNNKFFSAKPTPEYLDLKYFEEYIVKLDKIVTNFRNILLKYVELYDNNKLPQAQQIAITVQQPALPKHLVNELPSPLYHSFPKLKTTLTVDQLAYLFKLLKEQGLFGQVSNVEIAEFISKNFETPKTIDKEISVPKLKTALSVVEQKTAKELLSILRKMWDSAAKE
jgi:hypothetical protein